MNDFWTRAFSQLKADCFRTLLSLLGVTVGIFSVVMSLTLVDSIQESIRDSFDAFGSDLLFVEREPLEPDLTVDGVFRWWEYAKRPPVTWREYRYLADKGREGKAFEKIAFACFGTESIGVDGDWELLVRQKMAEGRGFSAKELERGLPVALAGSLKESTCGEAVWLEGKRYEVIGKFEKAGSGSVDIADVDHNYLLPAKTQKPGSRRSMVIVSGAKTGHIRNLLREYRRLKPEQSDDFALNRLSFLLDEMNEIFAMLSKTGWIIGSFSLLVGGFGIANMLFVSVEERKAEIGICRALGAKRKVILAQFLGEASLLSMLGGIVGIVLVALVILLVKRELAVSLTLNAVFSGLVCAWLIGLTAGTAPARHAAKLPPIKAIRR